MNRTELPLTSLDAALVRQVASGGRMSPNDAETLHVIANAIDAACGESEEHGIFLNKNATNPSLAAAEYATKRWAQFREEPRADVRDYIAFAYDDGWDAGKASAGCQHSSQDAKFCRGCAKILGAEQSEDEGCTCGSARKENDDGDCPDCGKPLLVPRKIGTNRLSDEEIRRVARLHFHEHKPGIAEDWIDGARWARDRIQQAKGPVEVTDAMVERLGNIRRNVKPRYGADLGSPEEDRQLLEAVLNGE